MAGKKGQREWGSIRKQGTKSGRYQASFVGPDLRRHFAPVTFDSRLNAERWLMREKDLVEKCAAAGESWQPPSVRKTEKKAQALSTGKYATDWISQRKLKPRTRLLYESLWKNNCEPKLGRVAVRDLNPALMRAWFSGLGGSHPTRNGHAYGLVHAICATAVKDRLLVANPCQIEGAMNPPTKKLHRDLSTVDVHAIADKLAGSERYQRFSALVLISAWCGLRWGEVIELRRRDFDADCETVSVTRGATHHSGKCFVDTPKDGRPAKVAIPPHIRSAIADHLSKHVDSPADSLLFPAMRSKCGHLNDRVFGKEVLAPVTHSLDLEGITHHSLRHFAGSRTGEVASLAETKQRLRHSTTKASERYQHAAKNSGRLVAERLSAAALAELNNLGAGAEVGSGAETSPHVTKLAQDAEDKEPQGIS